MRTMFARSGASSSMTSTVCMSGTYADGDVEARAAPGCALETDGAAMQLERLPDDREPQAGARNVANVARAVEGLEQPRLVFRRNADAVVRDFERGLAVLKAHPEIHRAALRGVLDGVGNQVDQHVAQQFFIYVDGMARAFVGIVELVRRAGR